MSYLNKQRKVLAAILPQTLKGNYGISMYGESKIITEMELCLALHKKSGELDC